MLNLGVLVSGGGTNLQAIIDACNNKKINANITVVLSDNKSAYALERAKKNNIQGFFIEPANQKEHEIKMSEILLENDVDLIIGAGYMRILTPEFVNRWDKKLINIHPALLPSFKGINGQYQALQYGVKLTGCTTHFIDEKTDHGPIILQAAIRLKDDDTRDTLAERILKVEHQLLPRTIDLFEQERLIIEGRTVKILPGDSWLETNQNPDVFYSYGY